MKKYIIAGIIVLGIWFLFSNCVLGTCEANGELDDFAKYLTEQGISMAGTDWCPHCKEQKKMFGSSFQYIDYHNCDKERAWCLDHGVQGYPTWVFPDGNLYPGTRSIEQLKALSGYEE